MDVVFIGTSSAMPAFNRWLPSILLRVEDDYLLMDCGEGTQYRVIKAGLKVNKLAAVFITHLHGDHFFGLPGLLETLGLLGREKPLRIYGPKGLEEFVRSSMRVEKLEYALQICEASPGALMAGGSYRVSAIPAAHGVEAYSYKVECNVMPGKFYEEKARELGIPPSPARKRLLAGKPVRLPDGREIQPHEVVGPPRPGLSLVYSGDTLPNAGLAECSKNVDVLIHEATFTEEHSDEAKISGHSTAKEAARIAKIAGAKMLVLFHYSGRYRSEEPFLAEARQVFRRTYASCDMLKISVRRMDMSGLSATFTRLIY